MNDKMNLEEINIFISYLEIYIISICTYYIATKIIDSQEKIRNKVLLIIILGIIAIICAFIRTQTNLFYSIMCLAIMSSLVFSKFQKKDITYSIMLIVLSLSINYIILIFAGTVTFMPNYIMKIQNDYIQFISLISVYMIFIYEFTKIKRIKKGLTFLKSKLENQYFNLMIINISSIILFLVIIASNYKEKVTGNIGIAIIFFSIIMFITIQKSLQLYYKQKLLIQDLNETKKELEQKKQELSELEKENLNFSKISHSIAHKQKSLEHKLNQIMQKNETISEIDLKERLNNITKELQQETTVELTKTNISEIDDILSYMQSECIKNNINFQVQLSGNIHHMINNHISKEKLEILLADHIKNAIIAIENSNNRNKSILVRLGIIEGIYSLYVYDSGIEFEIDTLANLGKKPSTTHEDDGGTGMGFMNTFDTLKEYQATMIIYEYGKPCQDEFTKVLQIKIDKKNEFKICSYRANEIEEKINQKSFQLEKVKKHRVNYHQ